MLSQESGKGHPDLSGVPGHCKDSLVGGRPAVPAERLVRSRREKGLLRVSL